MYYASHSDDKPQQRHAATRSNREGGRAFIHSPNSPPVATATRNNQTQSTLTSRRNLRFSTDVNVAYTLSRLTCSPDSSKALSSFGWSSFSGGSRTELPRVAMFLPATVQVPGTLHLIYNALEDAFEELGDWGKFEKQLVELICLLPVTTCPKHSGNGTASSQPSRLQWSPHWWHSVQPLPCTTPSWDTSLLCSMEKSYSNKRPPLTPTSISGWPNPVLKCKRIFALAESSRNTLAKMPSNLTEQ